jgi:antirestriction protein
MNLYVANLGKYTEGELVGDWITLPFDEDEFEEFLENKVGINEEYEEYAIHDYECDFMKIGEYENILKLNEVAEMIENLYEYDKMKLKAVMEYDYFDIIEAIENIDNYILCEDIENDTQLGEYMLSESGYSIPEYLEYYIDYEKFGRDYRFNAQGAFTNFGWVERIG